MKPCRQERTLSAASGDVDWPLDVRFIAVAKVLDRVFLSIFFLVLYFVFFYFALTVSRRFEERTPRRACGVPSASTSAPALSASTAARENRRLFRHFFSRTSSLIISVRVYGVRSSGLVPADGGPGFAVLGSIRIIDATTLETAVYGRRPYRYQDRLKISGRTNCVWGEKPRANQG